MHGVLMGGAGRDTGMPARAGVLIHRRRFYQHVPVRTAQGEFRSMTGSSHRRRLRLAALCVCRLGTCLLGTVPAWAQIPGLPATTETPPAAGGELEQLVKTLEDPQRRDRLLIDLKALLEAQRKAREAEKKRSEEHTSELQSLMRISYAVFC